MNKKFSENVRTYLTYCFSNFLHEKGWLVFPGTMLIMAILLTVLSRDEMFVHYSETRNGLFCITCAAIWVGIFNSVQSVCAERGTIKHEHMDYGISLPAYVLAHILYELVLCLVEAGIIQGFMTVFFRNGLSSHPVSPVRLYVTLLLILLSSDTMGLLISGVVRTATTAMTVMPFVLIVQLVMAGVIFELDGTAKVISNLTVGKWGMTALCSCTAINDLERSQDFHNTVYQHYFAEYSTGTSHLIFLWLILILLAAVFAVLTMLSLRAVDRDKR